MLLLARPSFPTFSISRVRRTTSSLRRDVEAEVAAVAVVAVVADLKARDAAADSSSSDSTTTLSPPSNESWRCP